MTQSHLHGSVSRRTALTGLGAGALGLALATRHLDAVAQEATPAATPFPMAGHPVIGVWRWSNGGGAYISFGTVVEDGGYVEAGPGGFAGVGIWRATGERTAELVVNVTSAIPLDAVFEPRYDIPSETCMVVPGMGFARNFIEV